MKALLIIFSFFILFQKQSSVADKIISFSLSKMGKKVDRGECWDLAAAALDFAGAKWESPSNFGNKVDYKKGLHPGDILQFENIKFKGQFYSSSFPHHTAIVYKTKKSDVTIFHQNYNNKPVVDTLTLHLQDLAAGELQAYRPVGK